MLTSLPQGSTAVVVGATGAIGAAVADALDERFDVVRLSRPLRSAPST